MVFQWKSTSVLMLLEVLILLDHIHTCDRPLAKSQQSIMKRQVGKEVQKQFDNEGGFYDWRTF